MFGNNPLRGSVRGEGNKLYIKNIFLTIQGEGEFVGIPSIFIRLGGCNLACTFCDTDFEGYDEYSLEMIIQEVEKLRQGNNVNLVTITGGEPLRQPIEKLCETLLKLNLIPQIETNGKLFRDLPLGTKIVCSPKASKNGYSKIREDLLPNLSSIKFLISKFHKHYDKIPEVGQSKYNIPVFIQPIDEYDDYKNKENTKYAVELSKIYGYRLSIQIHKLIGIE